MKKQNSAGQLFLSMFLKAAVIILGLAIFVFGIFFLTQVVKRKIDSKGDSEPVTTVDANVLTEVETHDDLIMNTTAGTTEEQDEPEPSYEPSYDKSILVLNSTEQIGLAGGWCGKLNEYGYNNTEASDYANNLSVTRIVAKQDGVGKDLIQYFEGAEYMVGTVDEGAYFDTSSYDIIIILGNDQTTE